MQIPVIETEGRSKSAPESRFASILFVAASSILVVSFASALPLHFVLFSKGFVTLTIFCVVYFRQLPSLRNLAGLVATATALAGLRVAISGPRQFFPIEPSVFIFFLGLASMWMLLLPTIWASATEKKVRMSEFGIALGVSTLTFMTEYPLRLSTVFSPQTIDYNLFRFDAALGIQSSFAVGRLLLNNPWIRWLCEPAYYGLPLMFVILATGPSVSAVKPRLWKSMLVAGILGTLLYLVVPAAGPIYVLYPYFPLNPPAPDQFAGLATAALGAGVARNCMPSLHFGWAFLILMNVQWSRWRRVGALILLVLTVLATLGFGEHYLVDLIVAVPFAVAINSAAHGRWRIAAFCAGITCCWLIALRWALEILTSSSWLAWLIVAATFGSVVFLNAKREPASRRYATVEMVADQE